MDDIGYPVAFACVEEAQLKSIERPRKDALGWYIVGDCPSHPVGIGLLIDVPGERLAFKYYTGPGDPGATSAANDHQPGLSAFLAIVVITVARGRTMVSPQVSDSLQSPSWGVSLSPSWDVSSDFLFEVHDLILNVTRCWDHFPSTHGNNISYLHLTP